MRSGRLYFSKLIFTFLPETRFFKLKNALLCWAGIKLGNNVRICSSVTVMGAGTLKIGDDTWIGHQVLICSGSRIVIGKYVDIGPRCYLGTGTHEIDPTGLHSAGTGINMDITIGDGAWLGANCLILPGVTIGKKSVIAAGAVVTKNVPPNVVVAGIPARVIRLL
ncbi:acyltransferase [Methylobacter psychrophilus]|uniref:acyltransferase n=1 Tax=Methylobacter psychrophilus TaxID=96941 RepID=UPI0021D4C28A|nr:acyltransferase [Methylobacter psychrophilus]